MASNFHMCIDIAGCLRNRSFGGFTTDSGKPAKPKDVERYLKEQLQLGRRVLPMVSLDECPEFSYLDGCPGHERTRP